MKHVLDALIDVCLSCRRKYYTAVYWALCSILAAKVLNGDLFVFILLQSISFTPLLWCLWDMFDHPNRSSSSQVTIPVIFTV